ncbi:sensor histidine kinase [Sphingomonas mucosissima]|uniref:sensor histidine kinase n=1 Tax=Sphingomonas mucosissima TaxID=370959 RepID=UPI001FEBCE33|nr:HAMP domain-containing sensor histidine kinase [Sphingomonas mucosissima]
MRFDDSLKTVLAADASTAFGAQATFRQLADLIARERVAADSETLGRLRVLRDQVPASVRAAVARSFALGQPPVELVAMFAEDEQSVASAALRAARLSSEHWISLIPQLGPGGRAALRRRDDLGRDVERALASFGSTDFTLAYTPEPQADAMLDALELGSVTPSINSPGKDVAGALQMPAETDRQPSAAGGFDIAELVDRIASYQQQRTPSATLPAMPAVDHFRFQTDAEGTVRWTDAMPRGALIGARLIGEAAFGDAIADAVVRDAFRQRISVTDACLTLGQPGMLAGAWRISAVPLFDPATGQFIGYHGSARRARSEHLAAQMAEKSNAEGLRRLVHELRTPTNAIAGFSELIETQLLGPVAPPYRERAAAIRLLAADLVATIEDLDLAARIEGHALELRPDVFELAPLVARVVAELQPLAGSRGCTLDLVPGDPALSIACDERGAERLLSRLMATFISAAQSDEAIRVTAAKGVSTEAMVTVTFPRALADMPEDRLLNMEAESAMDAPGTPLLGTGFALRLARNLAAQLGGRLAIAPSHIVVTLPIAVAALGEAQPTGQAV